MKQIIKILLILTIIIHSNFVKAETINWETTRNEVLKNAYDVQLSKIDINISKAKITGAKSEYYPKISAYAYNEYSRDLSGKSNQVVYVGNEVIYGDNIYQNALSLGLSYNLFDFGIRSENLKIAKTDSKSKQAAYYKALRDMELAAIDIYAKQTITSPCSGYVDKLFIHTVGGVVTPAQELFAITPADTPLLIKATVLNQDIGFIKEKMPVSVKIDTFNFQKYGMIEGEVKIISKNSIEDEKLGPVYEVYITPLTHSLMVEGKEENIRTGMSLTAEINVGKRRIIEFFIYPLIKYLDEGMSVR